jgi:signal transduction histidine kinase
VQELSFDAQQLSRQLHPAKIHQLGLVSAVRGFSREISGQRGLQVEFSHGDVPRDLPEDVSLCLYRVVQEALRNVVKHSGADEAAISLTADAGGIRLVVSDSGSGFDPRVAGGQGGLGFVSMQERLRLVGGQIEIGSQPGRGTRVVAWAPLPAEDAPAPGNGAGREDATR